MARRTGSGDDGDDLLLAEALLVDGRGAQQAVEPLPVGELADERHHLAPALGGD
jgi:hypothetical protein